MARRLLATVAALAMVTGGCSSASDTPADDQTSAEATPDASSEPAETPTPSPSDVESTPEPTVESTAPASVSDDIAVDAEGMPVDFLTYGAGAFPIQYEPDTQATVARAILDGLGGFETVSALPTGPESPLTLTVELPAATTIQQFAVPPMSSFGCCSGTHIATVTVEGTASTADEGWVQLAQFEVAPDVYDDRQVFDAETVEAVRWVRITLDGRQDPDPDDYRGTTFTDLLAFGTQEPREVSAGTFSGRWLTGGGGGGEEGNRVELIQDGSLVTGCGLSGGAAFTVSGGIENGLLRYVVNGDVVPSVAVINSEGQLVGAEIGRSYTRLVGEPGGATTDCTPTPDAPPVNPVTEALAACQTAVVYGINFDVDEDEIRVDAEPALRQILQALQSEPDLSVTIEGHTDSDGSDEYNLDLSDRRAASVVEWLLFEGIDAGRLSSVGKGEAEPLADNESSAGKAANRRVELEPVC